MEKIKEKYKKNDKNNLKQLDFVTTGQFGAIVFLVFLAQKILVLPIFLIAITGRDAWISLLIVLAIETAILLLIVLASKKTSLNFFEILQKSLGKIVAKAVTALLLVVFFIKLVIIVFNIQMFFNNMFDQNLRSWLSMGILCFLLFFIGSKSLGGIGRLAQIIMPLCVFALLVFLFFSVKGLNFLNIFPVLNDGFAPILSSIWLLPLSFLDIFITVLFVGRIKNRNYFALSNTKTDQNKMTKATAKWLIPTTLIASLTLCLFAMLFIFVLISSYSNLNHLFAPDTNLSALFMHTPATYRFGRFDIPLFSLLLLSLIVTAGLYFYALTQGLVFIFSSKKRQTIYSLISAIALYASLLIFFSTQSNIVNLLTSRLRILTLVLAILVPLFVFFTALIFDKKQIGEGSN
ncbi:MAG: spore germination protein [Firmicutes bacterium]|nr:spore germination protein [Bacillota bacterium]